MLFRNVILPFCLNVQKVRNIKLKYYFLGFIRRIQGNLPLGVSQLVTTPTVSLNRARRILQDQWRHTIRSRSVVIRNDVAELQIFRGVSNNGVDFSIAKHKCISLLKVSHHQNFYHIKLWQIYFL